MDRPHAHGLEGPREHPAPGGSPCPARKQQGPRAQRLRLQASTLSIPSAGDPPVWDLTPNPPHRPLPLLPGGERPRRRSWNLIPSSQPKAQPPPHPAPDRLPGTSSLSLLAHPLSLIANQHQPFIPSLTPPERLLAYPTSPGSSLCWTA